MNIHKIIRQVRERSRKRRKKFSAPVARYFRHINPPRASWLRANNR